MTLYLLPLKAYDERELGWRPLYLTREQRRQLKGFVTQMRGRPVDKVFASDLARPAGELVARKLRVPFQALYGLRPFNFGRHSGKRTEDAEAVLAQVAARWEHGQPTVPIRGGDSWTSFERRFGRCIMELWRGELRNVIIVTDLRGVQIIRDLLSGTLSHRSLFSFNSRLRPDSIYVVRADHEPSEALQSSATRPEPGNRDAAVSALGAGGGQ